MKTKILALAAIVLAVAATGASAATRVVGTGLLPALPVAVARPDADADVPSGLINAKAAPDRPRLPRVLRALMMAMIRGRSRP